MDFSKAITGGKSIFADLWLKHRQMLAGTILLLAVLAIYRQTAWFDFILFDDPGYVLKNPLVNRGLSWDAFCGIWTNVTVSNWHPLTMFSHQLDVTVFGFNAGGHHLTNVLLHGINTVLLFMAIGSFTGTLWRAFFVALLFAIHPLHVESVAWVSERKDMLSTLFGFLSLLAYRRYTAEPRSSRMALVTVFFALSLMSKPMLVTLPFLMLLLDWWPLSRFNAEGEALIQNENRRVNWKRGIFTLLRLTLEKWPLFLLSAGLCVITIATQHASGAVSTMEQWPLGIRTSNATTSLLEYLLKMFLPTNLGVFYPLPPFGHPAVQVALSAGVVMALSMLALILALRRSWCFTGWFWYLGTLVPVLGLVQVGSQSWADRYAYWPLTGLFIIISWEGVALWNTISSFKTRVLYMTLVLAALSVLGFTAWRQASYWKNTELLFKHTVEVVPNNWLAHGVLGIAVTKEGRLDEALEHYRAAYAMGPKNANSCNNLGKIFALRDETELSLEWHLRAIAAEPKSSMGYYCAANAMVKLGRTAEAEAAYMRVLSLEPSFYDALFNYANMLRDSGRHGDAEARYRDLIRSKPDHVGARLNLAAMIASDGKHTEAVGEYTRILLLEPENTMALNNMGKSLLFLGRPEESARFFANAVHIQPDNADARFSFALALAGSGRRNAAVEELRSALKINPSHSDSLKLMNELTSLK
ncbi:MAG: tetratricopeptide repeat protein [Victivallales bacterium]